MAQIQPLIRYIGEFNTVSILLRALLAVIAGGIIGSERGRHGRAAGFRTHILVCLGGAMTSLCSLYVSAVLGIGGDIFRIPASVVSGIGFLGAGVIMVRNDSTIAGLTTAAGMWVTAIIGVAFGYGFYGGAVLATVLCVVNAVLLAKVEHKQSRAQNFYLEVKNIERMQGVLDEIGKLLCGNCRIDAVSSKSGVSGSVGLEVTARNGKGGEELLQALCAIDGISYVIKR